MEELNRQWGKAAFTMMQWLQHAWVFHPTEAISTSDIPAGINNLKEHIEWFEVNGGHVEIFNERNPGSVSVTDNTDEQDPCPSTKNKARNRKIKAQFGRH